MHNISETQHEKLEILLKFISLLKTIFNYIAFLTQKV